MSDIILYYIMDNFGQLLVLGFIGWATIYETIQALKRIMKTKEEQKQKEYWNNIFEVTDLKA